MGPGARESGRVRVNVVNAGMLARSTFINFMTRMAHIQGLGGLFCTTRFTVGR